MKIGLFTDCHFCNAEHLGPTRRPKLSLNKIKEAMNVFKKENVQMVFCLGDLTDHDEKSTKNDIINCFKEALSLIKGYNIPFYLIPGNHDYLVMSRADIEKELGGSVPPYTIETEKHTFIALDANYRSNMECFDTEGVEWTDSNLPPFQMAFLEEELQKSTKPCIILVHENLDYNVEEHHIVKNADKARQIIEKCGKVKMVLQGHFHEGCESTINNIPYITIPAMCEGEANSFKIIEL